MAETVKKSDLRPSFDVRFYWERTFCSRFRPMPGWVSCVLPIWDWFIMKRVAALLVIFLAAPTLAFGQTSVSGAEGSQAPSTKALHGGILPLRDFGGDLSSRANLLGDWGGLRSVLAN